MPAPTVSPSVEIPKNEPTRWHWVVWQLKARGWSLRQLSSHHGKYSRWASEVAIRWSHDAQEAIAAVLELKPEVIWPERYVNGEPIRFAASRLVVHQRRARAVARKGRSAGTPRAAGGAR